MRATLQLYNYIHTRNIYHEKNIYNLKLYKCEISQSGALSGQIYSPIYTVNNQIKNI